MPTERAGSNPRLECFWRRDGPNLVRKWVVIDAKLPSERHAKRTLLCVAPAVTDSRFFFIPDHVIERRPIAYAAGFKIKNMLIEGVFAAATTPFYPDEKIYFRKIEANMARYSRSLLAGMVVLGSTGEAVALNDAESREVLRTAAEAAAPEKVLIAGVGRESVKGTVELAEAAARGEYD